MDDADSSRRLRLGKFIKIERELLGLSLRAAAKEAGISTPTWTAAERGTRATQGHNARPMEAVLGWAPLSFDVILAGGEPVKISESKAEPVDPDLEVVIEVYEAWISKLPEDERDDKLKKFIGYVLGARKRIKSRSSDRRDDDRPKTSTIG